MDLWDDFAFLGETTEEPILPNSLYAWCLDNGAYGERLISEWDDQGNRDKHIDIRTVDRGSGKKASWICSRCKSKYESMIDHRTHNKSGCPQCNIHGTSFPEQVIYHSIRQIFEAYSRKLMWGLEFDICIPDKKVCIEYNGSYWHKNREEHDEYKRQVCVENGYRLITIESGKYENDLFDKAFPLPSRKLVDHFMSIYNDELLDVPSKAAQYHILLDNFTYYKYIGG